MKRFLVGVLIFVGVLLLLILPQSVDPNQNLSVGKMYLYSDTLDQSTIDWELVEFQVGDDKRFDSSFHLAEKLALLAYPELSQVSISFVLTDGGAPMESNFELHTLLYPREQRVYEIRLNNAEDSMFEGILMKDLPFNAQVGIIAHELGHVLYYEQLSTLQLAKWGLMYLVSWRFRANHERSTDSLVIQRGLGSQLYQYAWFVRHSSQNQAMYRQWGQFMDKFYLTDQEVLVQWKTLNKENDR